jgi:hypothetical protein
MRAVSECVDKKGMAAIFDLGLRPLTACDVFVPQAAYPVSPDDLIAHTWKKSFL